MDKFNRKIVAILTLLCAIGATAGYFAGDATIPSSYFRNLFTSAISQENIVSLTNESREHAGLKKLRASAALQSAATKKAEDMLKNQYFAHIGPNGKTPWEFIKSAGYEYLFAGENLAIGFDSSEGVNAAWLASKAHKENILDQQFTEIGIGIARGKIENADATIVVQIFGTPARSVAVKTNSAKTPTSLASLKRKFRKLTLNFPSIIDLLKHLKTSALETDSSVLSNSAVASVQNFQSIYLVNDNAIPVKDILGYIVLLLCTIALAMVLKRRPIG